MRLLHFEQIIDTTRDTLKDNTGLHIKNLFIGSEGTLGIITKVAIHAAPRPQHSRVGLLAVDTFDDVRTLLRRARVELGEVVAATEYMDRVAFQVRHTLPFQTACATYRARELWPDVPDN